MNRPIVKSDLFSSLAKVIELIAQGFNLIFYCGVKLLLSLINTILTKLLGNTMRFIAEMLSVIHRMMFI